MYMLLWTAQTTIIPRAPPLLGGRRAGRRAVSLQHDAPRNHGEPTKLSRRQAAMSVFYGCRVKANKEQALVPRALAAEEGREVLTLTSACIPAACALKDGARVSLMLKVNDAELCAATLVAGRLDTVALNVCLDTYAELRVEGAKGGEVHVCGHYAPLDTEEEDADNAAQLLRHQLGLDDMMEEDEDEDSDDEEEEEEEEEESAEEEPGVTGRTFHNKRRVEITDVRPPAESGQHDDRNCAKQ
jgi:hypothetical protein